MRAIVHFMFSCMMSTFHVQLLSAAIAIAVVTIALAMLLLRAMESFSVLCCALSGSGEAGFKRAVLAWTAAALYCIFLLRGFHMSGPAVTSVLRDVAVSCWLDLGLAGSGWV